jgi:hypothetical protein
MTDAASAEFRAALYEIAATNRPCTVRQIYYRAVSVGLIDKTSQDYERVVYHVGQLRERGGLPWSWITDGTRLARRATVHLGVTDALTTLADRYESDLWADQDRRVELWVESDSIGGVLVGTALGFQVPLFAAHGHSSKTFAHNAAQAAVKVAEDCGQPTTVLYVGDYDPHGLEIGEAIEEKLRRYGHGDDLHFERIAITPHQIRDLGLQSHPAKRPKSSGDATRLRKYSEQWEAAGIDPTAVWEAEAMDANTMRQLVEETIRELIDDIEAWNAALDAMYSDRGALRTLAAAWGEQS